MLTIWRRDGKGRQKEACAKELVDFGKSEIFIVTAE